MATLRNTVDPPNEGHFCISHLSFIERLTLRVEVKREDSEHLGPRKVRRPLFGMSSIGGFTVVSFAGSDL